MNTANLIRIGESCQVGDGTHSKIPRQESGVQYLTSRNFKDGGLDLSQVYYISEKDFAKHFLGNGKALTRPEHGDLVFSIIGTIGQPYLVREHDTFGLSSSVAIVRPDKTVIDPNFLFYWFKGPTFQNALFGIKGGVAQGYVSLEMIRSLPVPKLPLQLQRRIAGILSAYDDLIENNQRRIKILEEMARSLYCEWFVNFRFPGHKKVPLVASPVGDIPKGWEVSSYGEAAYFENGDRGKNYPNVSEFMDKGVPFINAGHLAEGFVDAAHVNRITEEKFEQLRSGKIRDGDLLFCLRGSPGRTARVARLRRGAIASSLVIIRPTARANKEFLYYTLSSEIGRQMVTELDNGAAQPNISVGSLQKYPLVLPSKGVLNQFAILVEQNWKLSETLREQVSVLSAQRDLLLPRLLSGQLELPVGEAAA